MQVIETTVYSFDELNDKAKEKARDQWRANSDFLWSKDAENSIKEFCGHFGIKIIYWNVAPYSSPDYSAEYFNSHFRGLKLRNFKRDHMPTGYYLDCDLWMTFYDEFKRTSSAKKAFDKALWAGFIAFRNDLEAQLSDEYIDEHLTINEYQYTETGKLF